MSLYFEASKFLGQFDSSLKSRVFSDKNLKSQPSQLYALAVETKKWSPVLKEVIDNSSLLSLERKVVKLTPELALLLVHDLLLSKRGIAAPASHKLRLAIERNKARLSAELTKIRIRRKCSTLEELKSLLIVGNTWAESGREGAQGAGAAMNVPKMDHARWVRINRLKTTLDAQLSSTFSSYKHVDTIETILALSLKSTTRRILHVDKHIPDLIALPPNTDLSKEKAYVEGAIIIQDKASCFPAYLLDPKPSDGIVVDACAAPGNKTTHLASLRYVQSNDLQNCQIVACERDNFRANVLQKMTKTAGAERLVTIRAGQDFLKSDPQSTPWCSVGALLLDPSCSGSGIIGRDERSEAVALPNMPTLSRPQTKKRKREQGEEQLVQTDFEEVDEEPAQGSITKERLQALHAFQKKLVLHAFDFPKAQKVTYSTCSVHDEENEHVVKAVLESGSAKRGGWRILRREEQIDGMQRWHLRGRQSNTFNLDVDAETAEACIRCEKHTLDGTQGFFVAAFVRDGTEIATRAEDEDEWGGFED